MVNYTFGKGTPYSQDFSIQQVSGDLCIARPLDHETRNSYEIPVLATDRGMSIGNHNSWKFVLILSVYLFILILV